MHLSAFFWGMSTFTDSTARYGRFWHTGLVGLWLLALFLRWPYPEPGWIHIDERVFLLNPLKLWSGDLNPHFFIYPTLHIYLTSALYYAYYLLGSSSAIEDFVAYHFFVDGSGLIAIARHLNSLLSAATAVVVALAGRRLYGVVAGATVGIFLRYCRCRFVLRIWRQPIAQRFCGSPVRCIFRSASRKQVIYAIVSGRVFLSGWLAAPNIRPPSSVSP